MNNSTHISKPISLLQCLIIVLLLMIGGACASTHREKMLEESREVENQTLIYDELEARFTASQPTHEELKAFEVRAMQKLQDFADYLNLLYTSDLEAAFRQQAEAQIKLLFISDGINITLSEEGPIPLHELISESGKNNREAIPYRIQELEIQSPLQKQTDDAYTGSLSFDQNNAQESGQIIPRTAHFVVKKVIKNFGDEQEWVWEVLLSEIE